MISSQSGFKVKKYGNPNRKYVQYIDDNVYRDKNSQLIENISLLDVSPKGNQMGDY